MPNLQSKGGATCKRKLLPDVREGENFFKKMKCIILYRRKMKHAIH